LRLLVHLMAWAFVLALANAGNSIDARMAMMAMTTNNSISVKADPTSVVRKTKRELGEAEVPREGLRRRVLMTGIFAMTYGGMEGKVCAGRFFIGPWDVSARVGDGGAGIRTT
jgi:hypothetical protein